jgi:hypothetical protein
MGNSALLFIFLAGLLVQVVSHENSKSKSQPPPPPTTPSHYHHHVPPASNIHGTKNPPISQSKKNIGNGLSGSFVDHPINGSRSPFDPQELECNLCEYHYTIILATGRSGSTTLMDMVNQLPNYDIGGEHDGQLNVLHDLFKTFEHAKRFFKNAQLGSAWYNRVLPSTDFFCWA